MTAVRCVEKVPRLNQSQHRAPRRGIWFLSIASIPLLALLVVPLIVLLLHLSPGMLRHYLGDHATVQAIFLSLITTTTTLALAICLGTPLAYLLARGRIRGKGLIEVLVDMPTVLPPAVAGIALLLTLGRRGVLGIYLQRMGIEIDFTAVAVVIAQTFVAAPYFIKSATVGLASVSDELLEVAALDGASPAQTFGFVTFPLALRGLAGGAALCWSRALGEFGATIIFAGNYPGRTQTMPLAIYMGFESGNLSESLTLAGILLIVSFSLLLAIRAALRPVATD
ncbi:MAG TPA: ABC transporter permease [Tepidisphaeraceae bacterium]|jgi:molybdate transport system permease protein|nr:ABC transporter permease [Tepidisphaeraceae bacterium]